MNEICYSKGCVTQFTTDTKLTTIQIRTKIKTISCKTNEITWKKGPTLKNWYNKETNPFLNTTRKNYEQMKKSSKQNIIPRENWNENFMCMCVCS